MRARNETLVLGLFKFKHNEAEILRHCVVVPLTVFYCSSIIVLQARRHRDWRLPTSERFLSRRQQDQTNLCEVLNSATRLD